MCLTQDKTAFSCPPSANTASSSPSTRGLSRAVMEAGWLGVCFATAAFEPQDTVTSQSRIVLSSLQEASMCGWEGWKARSKIGCK